MAMVMMLLSSVTMPVANAHNADATNDITGLAYAQLFRYEMVRVLGLLAGQYNGADGSNPPPFISEFTTTTDACARVK